MRTLKETLEHIKKTYAFEFISSCVNILFKIEKIFYNCKCINYPKEQCIFSLWHAHQCGVFSCNMYKKTCIMVSNSKDGEIISRAANCVGVETVRGSFKKRGSAKGTLELVKKIKDDGYNGALTVDGPRGPNRVVKKGIIELARICNIPIVPAVYWSPQKRFLKFNSWDEFRFPLVGTRLVMLFGNPIDVPEELSNDELERIRKQVEDEMQRLYTDLKNNYKTYLKQK